jgi:hypothetical protein
MARGRRADNMAPKLTLFADVYNDRIVPIPLNLAALGTDPGFEAIFPKIGDCPRFLEIFPGNRGLSRVLVVVLRFS